MTSRRRPLLSAGAGAARSARSVIRVPAHQLVVGDVLQVNDRQLHVAGVERDLATAVLTAELGFLLHFTRDDVVDIVKSPRPRAQECATRTIQTG